MRWPRSERGERRGVDPGIRGERGSPIDGVLGTFDEADSTERGLDDPRLRLLDRSRVGLEDLMEPGLEGT